MTYSNFFDQINEYGIETPKSWGSLSSYPSVNLPNLMPTLSRGRNRFIPIPYNKHCKIVLEEGWGRYYHITYSTYSEKVVQLPEFDGYHRKDDTIALAEADRILGNRGYKNKEYPTSVIDRKKIRLRGGKNITVAQYKGNTAITHFNISIIKQLTANN